MLASATTNTMGDVPSWNRPQPIILPQQNVRGEGYLAGAGFNSGQQ